MFYLYYNSMLFTSMIVYFIVAVRRVCCLEKLINIIYTARYTLEITVM